jgi:hypothetical protein
METGQPSESDAVALQSCIMQANRPGDAASGTHSASDVESTLVDIQPQCRKL